MHLKQRGYARLQLRLTHGLPSPALAPALCCHSTPEKTCAGSWQANPARLSSSLTYASSRSWMTVHSVQKVIRLDWQLTRGVAWLSQHQRNRACCYLHMSRQVWHAEWCLERGTGLSRVLQHSVLLSLHRRPYHCWLVSVRVLDPGGVANFRQSLPAYLLQTAGSLVVLFLLC